MTKIGTGFIAVEADLDPFWRQVNRELGGRSAQFKRAGAAAGSAFGDGLAGGTRNINQANASLAGLNRTSKQAARGFTGLTASFGGAGNGARNTARALDDFGGSFQGATASISGVRIALAALVPTLIAFGGASVAAASSLAPLVGLAAAAGNALGSAAQGLGVFALATKGIGDALKEQTSNQLDAGGAAATAAGQQRAAARAIQSAQDGLRSAMQGVGDATRSLSDAQREQEDATNALAPAYAEARMRLRDLKDAVSETTLSLTGANLAVRSARDALAELLNGPDPRDLADAHRGVTNALRGEEGAARSLADAHRDLNELLKPADALDVADAQDAIADAIRNEERARLGLTKIIEKQNASAEAAGISAADWAEAVKNGLDFSTTEAAGLDAEQARMDLADAENAVGDAIRQGEHARRNLAKLEAGASQQEILDARQRIRDAERSVADAARQTIDARADLAIAESPATADEIANARHALATAENDVAEATKNRTRAIRELAEAEAQGIDGMAEVVAARDTITAADRRVQDAERDLQNANLATKRATQALGDAHLAAGEQASQQASSLQNLNEKMDALPPSAQAFVRQLIAMKPKLDELRRTAADGFFPGATAGLKAAMGSFESVNKVVGQTSLVLGDAAKKSGELVGSPAFGRDIETIGGRNAKVIGTLGEALRHVISALRHVMVAAGPLTQWLADVTNSWALNAAEAAKAGRESGKMAAFFERTRAVMERLGSIIGHLASGFLGVGKAGTQMGDRIWLAVDRAAKRFDEWANSARGQKALQEFFRRSTEFAAAFGQVLGGVTSAVAILALKTLPLTTAMRLIGPYADEATTAFIAYKLAALGVAAASKVASAAAWAHNAAIAAQSVNMVRWRASVALAAVSAAVMGPLMAGLSTAFWALNAAMTANPIGVVVVGLAALAAGAIYAYKHVDWFRNAVDATFQWIKGHWPLLIAILTGPVGIAVYGIIKHWRTVQSATETVWNAIKGTLTGIWNAIKASATITWETIKTAITAPVLGAASLIRNTLGAEGLTGWLSGAWGNMQAGAATAWAAIRRLVGDAVSGAASQVRNTLGSEGLTGWLVKAWENISQGAVGFATDIKDKIGSAFKGAANLVIKFVNAIIKAINLIPMVDNIKLIEPLAEGGTFGGSEQRSGATGNRGMRPQQFAHGGAFARTGGVVDRPITLMGEEAPSHPEFVIPTNPAYRERAQALLARAAGAIGLAEGGVIDAFRGAIKKSDAGPKPSLALWMAGIVESGLRNLTYGDRDSLGALQVRAGIHGRDLAMDPLRSALAFLNRGFTGIGGAISLAPHYASAGRLAQAVQGSGFPDRYDAVREQAMAYMKGKGGGGILDAIGGAIGGLGGIVGDLAGKGAGFLLDKLPGIGDLPDWLKGTGKHLLSKAGDYIKDKVGNLLSSLTGGNGGVDLPGGINGKIADVIALAQGMGFARPSVGQLTGGKHAQGSYHYSGRAADFGDAGHSTAEMMRLFNAIEARYGAKLKELYYDRSGHYIQNGKAIPGQFGGHGDHIHAALAQGGVFGGLPYGGSFANGGVVPGPIGAPRAIVAHGGETVGHGVSPQDIVEALRGMSVYIGNERVRELVDVRLERRDRALNAGYQAGAL